MLKYDTFDDYRIINLYDLCMNYIRDSGYELCERGYNIKPLNKLIEYFESKYNWKYDQDAQGYTLMNVNTNSPMSDIEEMHELATAYKCLCTLHYDDYINDIQYTKVKELYQQAYNDCCNKLGKLK